MNMDPDAAFAQSHQDPLPAPSSCVPILPHAVAIPQKNLREGTHTRKGNPRSGLKRDHHLNKDSIFEILYRDAHHLISENYSYKTESYYTILRHELEGTDVRPSSRDVLDAYIVPICLERAHLAGIPVCDWGISQGYVPLPSIIYGLNYFADTSEYCIVNTEEGAKEAIRHITNMGKYPFCYQKLPENATISTCISVFGKTTGKCKAVEHLAGRVYDLFSMPLVTITTVSDGPTHRLSSLSPTRYTQLSDAEHDLLLAYLNHQEFL
jgi:hypothetical protein